MIGPLTGWEAVLLGVVEGLTEFLPVSSTGHLILTSGLLGRGDDPAIHSFNIVVQGGAILAVLGLYRERVLSMMRGLIGRDPLGRRLLILLVVAFLPAGVLGPLLDKRIEALLFQPIPVALALGLGGIAMIVADRLLRRDMAGKSVETLTMRHALLIGLAQCLAMWPGTSRSLATILGGLAIGLSPAAAAEFSFLLALPTLGGATVYKLLGHAGEIATLGIPSVAIGMLAALVSAALAVKGFVAWLQQHGLAGLGVYRILVAIAVLVLW